MSVARSRALQRQTMTATARSMRASQCLRRLRRAPAELCGQNNRGAGIDNNYNNVVDEGCLPVQGDSWRARATVLRGRHTAAGASAKVACVTASTTSGEPASVKSFQAQEQCGNGIDDDCNGLIDDNCQPRVHPGRRDLRRQHRQRLRRGRRRRLPRSWLHPLTRSATATTTTAMGS